MRENKKQKHNTQNTKDIIFICDDDLLIGMFSNEMGPKCDLHLLMLHSFGGWFMK